MKTIIYFLLLCLPTLTYSNNDACLEIYGKIKTHRKILNEVTIQVITDGKLENQFSNSKLGKFNLLLNKGHYYELIFKKQGYFSQKIEVNTSSSEIEDYVWDISFQIDMLPMIESYKSSIMSKPFVSIRYSISESRFIKDINEEMLRIYNELTYNYKQSQHTKYTDIVRFADAAFQNGDYDAANRLYEKAEVLNPTNMHADVQMLMIERLKKIDAKNDKRYNELVLKAEQYYNSEELYKAKKFYAKALTYKDNEETRSKMASIKETITLKEVMLKSN